MCVCYFGPRVFRTSHTCMHVSIASFIPCIYCCLVYFRYKCLFVTSAGVFKNELITWMYCWLVFCCHFFQFFTLACLFAFVTPAGVFLEQTILAFIRSQLSFPIAAHVFLERTIHAFFPFLFNFSNRYRSVPNFSNCDFKYVYYFCSPVERVVWTDQARKFFKEMQFHYLNESKGLTRLRRCSFTRHKRHVIYK